MKFLILITIIISTHIVTAIKLILKVNKNNDKLVVRLKGEPNEKEYTKDTIRSIHIGLNVNYVLDFKAECYSTLTSSFVKKGVQNIHITEDTVRGHLLDTVSFMSTNGYEYSITFNNKLTINSERRVEYSLSNSASVSSACKDTKVTVSNGKIEINSTWKYNCLSSTCDTEMGYLMRLCEEMLPVINLDPIMESTQLNIWPLVWPKKSKRVKGTEKVQYIQQVEHAKQNKQSGIVSVGKHLKAR
jgi:hypothetical protein